MKIYLDTCSLQRPLDTKSQLRIILEAEAILAVLDLCDAGQVKLLTSEVLLFEVRRIQKEPRRSYALDLLRKGALHVDTNEEIERRARELTGNGIKPLDALHLASAIEAHADYFCTCDDAFLKKAKENTTPSTKVVSPIELVMEIDQ